MGFFEDTFTVPGGSAVNLEDHTPDVGDGYTRLWAESTQSLQAVVDDTGVRASANAGNVGVIYTCDATYPSANYEAEFLFRGTSAADRPVHVGVRLQDQENMYGVRLVSGTDGAQLYKKVSGTWSTLGSAVTIADGSVVKVSANGTAIKLYDDSSEVVSVTDSDISAAGKAWIASGGGAELPISTDDMRATVMIDTLVVTDLGAGGDTHEDALTLAREMAQTAVNAMDMLAALSFPRQAAVALAGSLQIEAALSLARDNDISFVGGLSSDHALTLARANDLAFVHDVTLEQAISLSRESGIDLSATLTLEEMVTLARTVGMNLSGVLVIEESLSLARENEMAVSGSLVLASDLSLARLVGLSLDSTLSKEVALSLARTVGVGQAAQLDAVGDLTLARVADLSAGSLAEFGAALTLARANGLGLAGALTLEEAVTLARSAAAVFASDLVSGGEIVGSVVELADSALYIVSLTDGALYVVSLTDSALDAVNLSDDLR